MGHVINLGNVDIMQHITKIAVVKNATAIWEYDPTHEDNQVLGGSLDVIAAIQTLAIRVTLLKSAWGPNVYDAAAWNATQVEEVCLPDFEQMLVNDADTVEWDKDDRELTGWSDDDNFELIV